MICTPWSHSWQHVKGDWHKCRDCEAIGLKGDTIKPMNPSTVCRLLDWVSRSQPVTPVNSEN